MGKFEILGKAIDEEFAAQQTQIVYLEYELAKMRDNNIHLAEILRTMADILENRH